jgi:hypothetical protein
MPSPQRASKRHMAEHMSPEVLLPSSQLSPGSRMPSPQRGTRVSGCPASTGGGGPLSTGAPPSRPGGTSVVTGRSLVTAPWRSPRAPRWRTARARSPGARDTTGARLRQDPRASPSASRGSSRSGNLPSCRTIAALTFTNKAAEEMQRAAARRRGPGRQGRVDLHLPRARRRDRAARDAPRRALRRVRRRRHARAHQGAPAGAAKGDDKRLDSGAILARISHAKNAMCTPEELAPRASATSTTRSRRGCTPATRPRSSACGARLRRPHPLAPAEAHRGRLGPRGLARASATCWSTSFRTPTARSCCW